MITLLIFFSQLLFCHCLYDGMVIKQHWSLDGVLKPFCWKADALWWGKWKWFHIKFVTNFQDNEQTCCILNQYQCVITTTNCFIFVAYTCSRLPYSTDSYFHDFDICICQCFMTNIKVTNMKNTAGKSASVKLQVCFHRVLKMRRGVNLWWSVWHLATNFFGGIWLLYNGAKIGVLCFQCSSCHFCRIETHWWIFTRDCFIFARPHPPIVSK